MARIIKAAQVPDLGCASFQHEPLDAAPPVLDAPIDEALLDPHSYIEHARAEIEREAEQLYRAAREQGLADGHAELEQVAGRCEQTIQAIGTRLLEAQAAFHTHIEGQLRNVVFALAQRVIRREVRGDAELVITAIRAALNELADRRRLVVHIHPSDLAVVRGVREQLIEEFDGIGGIEIYPDEAIEQGGCIVESDTLHVDARLATQLKTLLDTLFD